VLFSELITQVNRAKQNVQGLIVDTDTVEYNKFLAEQAAKFLDESNFTYAVEATATVSLPSVVLRTQFTPPLKTVDRLEYRLSGQTAWTPLTDTTGNPSAESVDLAMVSKGITSVRGAPTTYIRTSVSTIRLIPDPPDNIELLAWGIRVFSFDPTAMSADMQVPLQYEEAMVSYCVYKLLEGVPADGAKGLYEMHGAKALMGVENAKIENASARRLSRGSVFKPHRRRVVSLR
jgi:hypothetical protein